MWLYAVLGLGLSLFGGNLAFSSNGFFSHFFQEIGDSIRDPQTQRLILSCLCFYFTTLMLLQPGQQKASFWRLNTWELWMIAAFVVAAFSYFVDYPAATQSTQPLVLFAGATLGKGASVLAAFQNRQSEGGNGNNPERSRNNLAALVASLLVILLALASIWGTNAGRGFGYDGNARRSGPWENPNIFGLLMGTGIVLAVGFLLQSPMSKAKTQKVEIGKRTVLILGLLAEILLARGLLHSYSRGAWVATVCGLGCLVWRGGQAPISERQRHSCISQSNRNWLPCFVILASLFLLVFWHSWQTNWHPARRALSLVNTADFSWRNRIVAWEGDFQIMAEHPWLGTGWSQPEALYEHYYLPPKLNESAAIEMNDYLMLGATLGVPALCCFAIYLWLSLGGNFRVSSQNSASATLDGLQTICHAGAIVLLVGFWFDGGLFKLPTASIFWILLELGSCGKNATRKR